MGAKSRGKNPFAVNPVIKVLNPKTEDEAKKVKEEEMACRLFLTFQRACQTLLATLIVQCGNNMSEDAKTWLGVPRSLEVAKY